MSVKIHTQSLICTDHPMQKVRLFPCEHKMERIFAEKRYGKMVDGFCELTGKRCEVCTTEVEAYGSAGEIYTRQLNVERVPNSPPPYPGIPAVFKLIENDCDEIMDRQGKLCRAIGFKSITESSSIEEFELLGYLDGSTNIGIKFKKNACFQEYLTSHGMGRFDNDFCMGHNLKELRTLFRIISCNNKIPPEELKRLTSIVEQGTCDLFQKPKDWPMQF